MVWLSGARISPAGVRPEERDLTHAVTSRSFRGFISLLVINGGVSFLMEGNREEMVSCVHLSGLCLNGRSHSLDIGHGCVFSWTRSSLGWGWMSDVWMVESSQAFLCEAIPLAFPIPILSALRQGRPASRCRWTERDGLQFPAKVASDCYQLIRWKLIFLASPCSRALPRAAASSTWSVQGRCIASGKCVPPPPSGFGAGSHRAQSF